MKGRTIINNITKVLFITLIIITFGAFVFLGTPYFTTKQLLFKHIIIFLISMSWLYIVTLMISKHLLPKARSSRQITLLYVSRTLSFVLATILITSYQVAYIEKKDSYIDYRCEYYDEYYNLIFASPRIYYCPDLDIRTINDNELMFSTYSEYTGIKNLGSLETLGITGFSDTTVVTVLSSTDTVITYDSNHHIQAYTLKLTEHYRYTIGNQEQTIYYSSYKDVTNDYESNSFTTTLKQASYIEPQSSKSLSHYPFNEEDYTIKTTYTTRENIFDYEEMDADYYIVESNNTLLEDELVGLGYDNGVIFYNLTDNFYRFTLTEASHWVQDEGEYVRTEHSNRINSLGTVQDQDNLGYELQQDGYYYLMSKTWQKPTDYIYDTENTSWSFGQLQFSVDGNVSYYVIEGMYYTFIETDYGMKVIDRRNDQYNLIGSLTSQQMETSLSIMNDQFLDLHNYNEMLFHPKYYVPQIIINSVNPLYLYEID